MKIWIVTNGQYSDKKNIAVFSNEQEAEDFRNEFFPREGDIEVFEVDCVGSSSQRLLAWDVHLDYSDGELLDAKCCGLSHDCDDNPLARKTVLLPGKTVTVSCYAKDRDHAVKIASEKWTQWAANTSLTISRAQMLIESGDPELRKRGLSMLDILPNE